MEYKMKKSMALGVVIMLCAVAMIGAGYAAFNGHARTYNEGNSAEAGFMTLTPSGTGEAKWDAITSGTNNGFAYFDTYTYYVMSGDPEVKTDKFAYYFNGTSTTNITVGEETDKYTIAQIGTKDFVVSNETGAQITSFTLKIIQNNSAGNTDFKYIVKVGDVYQALSTTGATSYDSGALTFSITQAIASGSSGNITVDLFVGYSANIYVPNTFMGPADAQSATNTIPAKESGVGPTDLASLTLGFSVEIPSA